MASIVNIPFNFQPVGSPSRKTASYIIPAGRYAKAVLSFYQPRTISNTSSGSTTTITVGAITINGVEVLKERAFNITLGWYPNTLTSINFSGFGGLFNGIVPPMNTSGWTQSILSNGQIIFTTTNSWATSFPVFFGVNNSLQVTSGGGANIIINGHMYSPSTPESIEVWLKAGDVITGTAGNWQAVVTEYVALN